MEVVNFMAGTALPQIPIRQKAKWYQKPVWTPRKMVKNRLPRWEMGNEADSSSVQPVAVATPP